MNRQSRTFEITASVLLIGICMASSASTADAQPISAQSSKADPASRYRFRLVKSIPLAAKDFSGNAVILVTDFDGDGKPELVYSTFDPSANQHFTHFFEFTPPGFSYTEVFTLASFDVQDTGDLDQDGLAEIYGQQRATFPNIFDSKRIYEQINPTAFPSAAIYSSPSVISGVISDGRYAGDLDRDGKQEMMWTEQSNTIHDVHITEATGNNTFTDATIIPATWGYAGFWIGGDLDHDGMTEFAVSGDGPSIPSEVMTYQSVGDNAYAQEWSYSITNADTGVYGNVLADADRDGLKELAIVSRNFLSWPTYPQLDLFESVGLDQYQPTFHYVFYDDPVFGLLGARVLAAATRHGLPSQLDLIVSTGELPKYLSVTHVYIFENVGNDQYVPRWSNVTSGGPVIVTDLDSDGYPELVFNTSYSTNGGLGTLSIFENY